MKSQVIKQKGFVFLWITVIITVFGLQGLGYAQAPNPIQQSIDVLIFTGDTSWISQQDAIAEAETTKNLLQSADITAEITEDEDYVKQWMLQTTSNGSVNVLILYGTMPTTIYPPGNTMPDGSVVENWIETTDGNTILNHTDYIGFSSSHNTNTGRRIVNYFGMLRNLMDNPNIYIPILNSSNYIQMIVTSDGSTLTPSLVNFETARPIPLGQLQGNWFAEKILASNTGDAHADWADPVVLRDGDRGRIAIVHQTVFEDEPIGEVAAEIMINYLFTEAAEETLPETTTVPLIDATLDVLIYTGDVYWLSHADAKIEAEKTKNRLQSADIHAEIIEDENYVKQWMLETTSNGSVNVLILYGTMPATIYPSGNTMPDGSVAEIG